MLIPSIDLQDGARRPARAGRAARHRDADDLDAWIAAFRALPEGAADRSRRRDGHAATTARIVRQICGAAALPRRRRHPQRRARAQDVLAAGAHAGHRRLGAVQGRPPSISAFATTLADAVGAERVIAAVDSRGGHVVDPRLEDACCRSPPSRPFGRSSRSATSSSTRTSTPRG